MDGLVDLHCQAGQPAPPPACTASPADTIPGTHSFLARFQATPAATTNPALHSDRPPVTPMILATSPGHHNARAAYAPAIKAQLQTGSLRNLNVAYPHDDA